MLSSGIGYPSLPMEAIQNQICIADFKEFRSTATYIVEPQDFF